MEVSEITDRGRHAGRAGSPNSRWILQSYVARELVLPTLLALLAFTLVVLIRDLPAYVDLVLHGGAHATRVARIALAQALTLAAQMLPFAVLLGALVGLGRLVADREILVLSALGFDPRRWLVPTAAFSFAMAGVALVLSLAVSPLAQRALDRAVREIAEHNPVSSIEPGVVTRLGEWKLEAGAVSGKSRALERVLLWVPSFGETIFSRSAVIHSNDTRGADIVLRDGLLLTNTRAEARAIRFDELRTRLPPTDSSLSGTFGNELGSLAVGDLATLARSGEARSHEATSELHRRFALPAATALLGLLAAPLALARSHSSRSRGALIGLLITLAYYGLVQAAQGLAERVPRAAEIAVWLPNGVLLAATLLLCQRTFRPVLPNDEPSRLRTFGLLLRPRRSVADTSVVPRARRWPLPRHVAARFTSLALVSLAVLVAAYLIVDVLERLEWFARHAARFDEIAYFYTARIPLLISRVVPMGLVAAMALTVGLLASSGELMGMRTLGISTRQALRPAVAVCLLTTPLSFLLNDQVVPRTNELADLIKQNEIKGGGGPRTGPVWGRNGDTLFQLESFDAARGAAEDIVVYPLDPSGLPKGRIDARSIVHVGDGQWRLNDATAVAIGDGGHLNRVDPPERVELGTQPSADTDLMYFSVAELIDLMKSLRERGESTTDLELDLNLKFATPLACLFLPLLVMLVASSGPPFPSLATTLILAAVFSVAYTLLTGAFASLGRSGALAPWLGGWGASLSVVCGVIAFVWRDRIAGRDA